MKSLVIGGIIVLGLIMIGSMFISYNNKEVMLRTTMVAQQLDNTSVFDNMGKKISQVAQVSVKQMEMLKEIFASHAQARSTGGDQQVMTWIKESIPNVDTTTFNNLQNIIVSSRDAWTMSQRKLIDLKREHDQLLQLFPSNIILGMLGKKPFEIKIITSSKTEKAFETGKDDDVKLF